jgi:hypothetical protein
LQNFVTSKLFKVIFTNFFFAKKRKIEKFSFCEVNLIFSKKINILWPGGEPAMVLRYLACEHMMTRVRQLQMKKWAKQPMNILCMGDLCVGVRQLQLGVRHLPLEDLCVADMFLKNVIMIHKKL